MIQFNIKDIITAILPIFLLCISFKNQSIAQTNSLGLVMGRIVDSVTQKPLDLITINLKNESKQIIRSSLSKADGTFRFEKLSSGNYTINFISVGYTQREKHIELTDTIQHVDLGILLMNIESKKLSEITITGSRPVIKQEIDRISYDLQADPESKGSTVLEMMRKVPLLSVDGEDNVLLQGNKGYKILINGKPSSMMERNAKDILRSMPASSIKNIEVIFNPSSKYDAEGGAGLINIITDKKVDNGYKGSLNVSEKYPVGGPGTGGTFTLKQGKFGLSFLGGGSSYFTPQARSINNRVSTGVQANVLDQTNSKESESKNGYLSSEFSFEIDSLNLISTQININGSRSSGNNVQTSMQYNDTANEGYNLANVMNGTGKGKDVALNYQLGFKANKIQMLTLSYRYLDYSNDQFNKISLSEKIGYSAPDYDQTNYGSFTEQTFQIDYIHPIKKLNIEAGVKSIFRTNESDFRSHLFNSTIGTYELNPSLSNTFSNRQDVYAAYNSYTYNIKDWGFRAGLRIEQTVIDGNFISTGSEVKQNYLNVIPSLSASRKISDRSSLVLSYIKRMQRPGINQLNPFIDRSNPSFETTGNPKLTPTFINIVQLSYNSSKKANVNISAAYMFANGLIGPVSVYDPVTSITRTTFQNMGRGEVLKSNMYLNCPINKRLSLTLNSDVRYLWLNAFVNSTPVHSEILMASANLSSGYRFNRGLRLNGSFLGHTPNLSGPQGRVNGFIRYSLSMSKDLIKNKLSFSASVDNPFTKYREIREETFGPSFTQLTNNQTYYRTFSTSLNYRFGKLKQEIKKNKRGIENDDVVNSK